MSAWSRFWATLLSWFGGGNSIPETPTATTPSQPVTPTPPVSGTPAVPATPSAPVTPPPRSSTPTSSVPVTPVPNTPVPVPSVPVTPAPSAPVVEPAVPPPVVTAPPTPPALPTPRLPTTLPSVGVKLDFRKVWNSHPTNSEGEVFPCRDANGNPSFDNECAILMGTCLHRLNLLGGYDYPKCWYEGHVGHTLRAREVSDWMKRNPNRFGKVDIRSNVTWRDYVGRTGIVCFQNFWGLNSQGDHIDVWDGTGIVRHESDPSLEGVGMAHGSLDYFERSQEVWFWDIY